MATRYGGRFDTTNWSLIQAAGATDPERSGRALAELYEAYWPPLYAFARRRGHAAEDAADLIQGYFAHLLERRSLSSLVPGQGRFRSFVLTSFKNLLNDETDKRLALKRGAGSIPISLDLETAEGSYRLQPTDGVTPERLFERQWAETLLERVLLRMQEGAQDEEAHRYERLKIYLTGEVPAPTYREVATDLNMTEDAVKMAVYRMRRRFGEHLRDEVSATVASPDDVDDEIRHMLAVLQG